MSSKLKLIIILILAVAVLGGLAFWRISAMNAAAANKPKPAPAVVAGAVGRGTIVNALHFTGDVSPILQANIFSRTSGNIEYLNVDIGSRVRKGEVLGMIDTSLYAAQMRQAYGAFLQTRATFVNDSAIYERGKNLFSKKLIAQQDLDGYQAQFDVARSQVDQAFAAYRNTKILLEYCKLTAPFSGSVTKRLMDPGTYVTTAPNIATSTIVQVTNLDSLKIIVNVLERDVQNLSKVSNTVIHADALPDTAFHGLIARIDEAVDLTTRTLPVMIIIPNKDHALKPGMFVNIDLILGTHENAMLVGSDVVMHDDAGAFVFTVGADSVAHKHTVQTGAQQNNKIEIVGGITDNDRVITVGQDLVKDGAKVKLSK